MQIVPVILAGGEGNRLWPLSRRAYPKQFSSIVGDGSFLQQALKRTVSDEGLTFSSHLVITNERYRFIVGEQAREISGVDADIIIEPEPKNTAPAILAASLIAMKKVADPAILVLSSDHSIPCLSGFREAVKDALPAVALGNVLTFGVKPTRPETGYGYLELPTELSSGVTELKSFVEKPELAEANEMVNSGNYLWNAGIFLFRASDIVQAFKEHAPILFDQVQRSVAASKKEFDFTRLDESHWGNIEGISFDYAIMEKLEKLMVSPLPGHWSDLGDWESVWREMGPNETGVAKNENAYAVDCSNSLLRAESEGQKVVGFGLENIIVVAMRDAVLVADKARSQSVKSLIPFLRSAGVSQADEFTKDFRPWGWFESIAISENFQVKKIVVHPQGSLSLQKHFKRSEHWVVVSGNARVTIDEKIMDLTEGQAVYVPLGAVHRLENKGSIPLVLIEVQIGSYLGEDDIVRLEDIYARS